VFVASHSGAETCRSEAYHELCFMMCICFVLFCISFSAFVGQRTNIQRCTV
jgi:hypothetical protein